VERFGVSRPSLREALRILEARGLISVVRGRGGGVVVHEPDGRITARTARAGAPGAQRVARGRPRGAEPARADRRARGRSVAIAARGVRELRQRIDDRSA
jgi:DNA-binding GntR family transcriptional regulator